ncbi:MAG TPA: hypothetical protein VMJ65_02460 [Solirubrobacteraceae bacterium]|nr:hypothetical protein [Solirubrobacteraceae bacterium]
MTDQTELRAALRERAAHVPASSIDRLVHHDYHPRTRLMRPPVAIGALATAGAAGAVAVVISLSAGASNAFAGWSPTPTPPGPKQLAAANADCQTQSPIAGLPLKLSDTRGPFTFSVYADANASATCIKGPAFTAVSGNESSAPISVPAGHILLSSSHTANRAGDAYSFADGRAGDGVSAVTLTLDDGSQVQATVANGWFVAWWPDTQAVKSAAITTPTGMTTQTFPAASQAPCGPQPCPSGGFSQSSGFSGGGGGANVSGFSEAGGSSKGGRRSR